MQPRTPGKGKHVPDAFGFIERRNCPVCSSSRTETIFCSSFGEGVIGRLIRDYYAIDAKLVSAAPYELMHCPNIWSWHTVAISTPLSEAAFGGADSLPCSGHKLRRR